jgi:hypothetical protein
VAIKAKCGESNLDIVGVVFIDMVYLQAFAALMANAARTVMRNQNFGSQVCWDWHACHSRYAGLLLKFFLQHERQRPEA